MITSVKIGFEYRGRTYKAGGLFDTDAECFDQEDSWLNVLEEHSGYWMSADGKADEWDAANRSAAYEVTCGN